MIEPSVRGEPVDLLVRIVRAGGHPCDSVTAARSFLMSDGFELICDKWAHHYEVTDVAGQPAVERLK